MKSKLVTLTAVLITACLPFVVAADNLQDSLQSGLLQEEAHQNLDAAIKAYQAVLDQFQEQRKIAATAAFRLGECYRKQGKTNEALAAFQRVVREFPEQSQLVQLSQKLLAQAGRPSPDGWTAVRSATTGEPPLDAEQAKLLEEEIKLIERQLAEIGQRRNAGRAEADEWIKAKRDLLSLQRKLPENSSSARQQALIGEEMKLVQQLVDDFRKRLEVGAVSPIQEVPLKRDLLALQRELIAVSKAQEVGTVGRAQSQFQSRLQSIVRRAGSGEEPMDEEAKEIQRLREILQHSPDLINAKSGGVTPLQKAASKGQLEVARFLLDNHAEVNAKSSSPESSERTALHFAAQAGHKAMAELLLTHGAPVDSTDRFGSTPLHLAAAMGFQAVAQVLHAKGADVSARTESGETPLHHAVSGRQNGMVELLLKNKADVNAQTNDGITALMRAVGAKQLDLVELLLSHKADVNLRTKNGGTALTIAVQQGNDRLIELLLARGADPNVETEFSVELPGTQRFTAIELPLH